MAAALALHGFHEDLAGSGAWGGCSQEPAARARAADRLKERLPRPPGGHLGISSPGGLPWRGVPEALEGTARIRNISRIVDRALESPGRPVREGTESLYHEMWSARNKPNHPTSLAATNYQAQTTSSFHTSFAKLTAEHQRHLP
mmetsp:Transcript_97745/g.280828  ORF Transcript_97745/g.280828 Transcript_97745/m.280828 type:complete len:144 (-) Transcript_97745:125-556(-)